jgi:hypothetical protein
VRTAILVIALPVSCGGAYCGTRRAARARLHLPRRDCGYHSPVATDSSRCLCRISCSAPAELTYSRLRYGAFLYATVFDYYFFSSNVAGDDCVTAVYLARERLRTAVAHRTTTPRASRLQ